MANTTVVRPSTVDSSPEEQRVLTYAQAGVEGVREEMRRNPEGETSSKVVGFRRSLGRRASAIPRSPRGHKPVWG
jgi:hypothetical protein